MKIETSVKTGKTIIDINIDELKDLYSIAYNDGLIVLSELKAVSKKIILKFEKQLK
jgi:hypothetical protein